MSSQIQGDRNNPIGWVCSYFTSGFHWNGTLVVCPADNLSAQGGIAAAQDLHTLAKLYLLVLCLTANVVKHKNQGLNSNASK